MFGFSFPEIIILGLIVSGVLIFNKKNNRNKKKNKEDKKNIDSNSIRKFANLKGKNIKKDLNNSDFNTGNMELKKKINSLGIGEMTVYNIDLYENKNTPVFIIKEKKLPPKNPSVETRYQCFLAQKDDITIPFLYFMAQFAELSYFTYEILLYAGNSKKIDDIKKLLTYKNQRIFCFVKERKIRSNNKIVFDNIITVPGPNLSTDDVTMDLFFEKYNEHKNKACEKDFNNHITLFWDFLGSRIEAWDLISSMNLKYGPIVEIKIT